MTGLRAVFSFITVMIGILVLLCGLCWAFSTAGIGVSFITIIKINLFDIVPISIPIFHCLECLKWYFSGGSSLLKEPYLADPLKFLAPFFFAGFVWLMLRYVTTRILRLAMNKKTTLHGSAKWADEEELENAGLLGETGVVMGQTYDAVYKGTERKPPERKRGESLQDFHDRQIKWTPGKDYVLQKKGDIIMQQANAHTLVVGSTRSGKGVGCIIPTAFKWTESLLLFDPKEENWQITSAFRAKFSYCFKFQPENPKESIHYNPLLSIRRGVATMPDIQNLCLSLIAVNEQSKDPFWDNEARKLLASVIGYVIYCNSPENKTFREVYSIFTAQDEAFDEAMRAQQEALGEDEQMDDEKTPVQKRLLFYADNAKKYKEEAQQHLMMTPEQKEQFLNRYSQSRKTREKIEDSCKGLLMQEDLDNIDRIMQDLTYFGNCEPRQLSSVVSTMMSNLQVIADPNVQTVTDRSDFTIEDFLDGIVDDNGKVRPISLYLVTSLASMQRLVPIMKIFYEQAITLLTRELKKRPYRLLLIFDEFRQMGKMEIVERALALSAGYGVICMIIIQSYEQLKTLYQSDALFTDNFAYQIILRVNDNATCKKIEEMLGQSTKKHTKMNTSGNLGEIVQRHESYDVQEIGRSLMTAEEVRTMPDDEEVIIASGMHPYRAKKVRYYLDNRFTPLYRANHGKGKQLPCPSLEDNYPHPEILEKDPVTGKMVAKSGLDREGWHLLLGYKCDIEKIALESKPTADNIEREFDSKEDIIVDAPRNQEEEKKNKPVEPNPTGISDLSEDIISFYQTFMESK